MTPQSQTAPKRPTRILFVGTEDVAFCRHRLPMARALKQAGHEIVVCARDLGKRADIEREGFRFVPWQVKRANLNPILEWRAYRDLRRIFNEVAPDIAINVALQPILYGGLCARARAKTASIALFAGLGAMFINPRPVMKAVQKVVVPLLRYALSAPNAWVITQNRDNQDALLDQSIGQSERHVIIPGSGLDLEAFPNTPEPDPRDGVHVALMARMLWDKGIAETLEAARQLRQNGVNVHIDLFGAPDPENPASLSEDELQAFNREGAVHWHGPVDRPNDVWRNTHIALLPSYGEGIPKSLLEAASVGRPLVGFDAPGVRDLIEDGTNGVLVPFKDSRALAQAIQTLAEDRDLRAAMGAQARKTVERTYAAAIIGERLNHLVDTVLQSGPLDRGLSP